MRMHGLVCLAAVVGCNQQPAAPGVERGRILLNLDTAADHGAAPLYDALGWTRVGEIPGYAYKPHGGLTATILYYKQLAPAPR